MAFLEFLWEDPALEVAEPIFRTAIERSPNRTEPHFWLGEAYKTEGRALDARREFLAAVHLDRKFAPASAALQAPDYLHQTLIPASEEDEEACDLIAGNPRGNGNVVNVHDLRRYWNAAEKVLPLKAPPGTPPFPRWGTLTNEAIGGLAAGGLRYPRFVISRLYANNFRCLVAFETRFDSFGLLCGPNGAGKSSVFDVLRLIKDLGSGETTLESDEFRKLEFTSWLDSSVQEFEVDIEAGGHRFSYLLHIEQAASELTPRIVRERASSDNRELFDRDLEGVRFKKASGEKTGFPLDWRQAALGSIQPAGDRRDIQLLQEALAKLAILRPVPHRMEFESKGEAKSPRVHLGNLTSWYRALSQEQDWTDDLRDSLRGVWPDFRSFRLVDVGMQTKALQLRFGNSNGKEALNLYLDQLSDGEKMLVGLYMVRSALSTGAIHTALIDEPDNFVGLPELQPWVVSVLELLDDERQAVLISHHPEIVALAREEHGKYLWRDNHTSPTRIGPLIVPEGMSAGEAIARGWVA
jgi:predicted ATPase